MSGKYDLQELRDLHEKPIRRGKRAGGAGLYWWLLALSVGVLIALTQTGRGFLFLAGIQFVGVAIHEAGHYIAALKLRYRVSSVRVGPFELIRGYRAWRMHLGGIALDGHVEASPPDDSYAPRRQVILVAAGPLANFATMIVLHGLYMLLAMLPAGSALAPVWRWMGGFTEALALWSGAMGLYNLIPFRTRRQPSDGMQLLQIWRRSRSIGRR